VSGNLPDSDPVQRHIDGAQCAETAVLYGYPVVLGQRLSEHTQDVLRELKLIELGASAASQHEVPARLQAMAQALSGRYAQELDEADQVRSAAAARGQATCTLSYPLRRETEQDIRGWQMMVDEADTYSEASSS